MTKETVVLYKEDIIKAHGEADAGGKKTIELMCGGRNKLFDKIEDRLHTFEDVCIEMGKDPSDYVVTSNMDEDQRSDVFCDKVRLIFKAFRQGWKSDYTDKNQRKWYGWYEFVPGSGFVLDDCIYGYSNSLVGARLSLPDEKLYRLVAKRFQKEISDYLSSN